MGQHVNLIQLGDVLRKKRKELGLRLEDLADEEISPSTISNIERGLTNVNFKKIRYFAGKLGVDLEQIPELIDEEKEKEKKLEIRLQSIEHIVDLVSPDTGMEKLRKLKIKDNHPLSAFANYIKGKCYIQKNNWEKAQKHFFEVIRLTDKFTELSKTNLKAGSYNELARTFYFNNELEEALDYVHEGLEAFDPDGERKYFEYVLNICKVIYLEKLERLEEAHRTLTQLWEQMPNIQHLEVISLMYETRAILLKKMKLYEEAIQYAWKGIEIARINKIHNQSFELWTTLGSIYIHIDELDEAENCFLTALCLKEKIKKEYLSISTYTQLGLVYIEQKKWKLAQNSIEEALKIGKRTKHVYRYNQALIALGDCYLKQELYSEAIGPYQEALKWAQTHAALEREHEILLKLAQCWRKSDQQQFQKCMEKMYEVQVKLQKGGEVHVSRMQ